MTEQHAPLWADQSFLRDVQYRDEANLAARQSIYAYAEPKRNLIGLALASLELAGRETVADVGCGNGRYLAGLAARGHRGRVLGLDLSPGMLSAARLAAPRRPGLRRRCRAARADGRRRRQLRDAHAVPRTRA